MTVPTTIDAGAWLGKYLELDDADSDLPRAMLAAFAEALMSAEASMQCGAGYGERSEERENSRNGYRHRPWDTRVGTIDLAVPKLRSGVYSPEFLLQPRRRAEQALMAVDLDAHALPESAPVATAVATARNGRSGIGWDSGAHVLCDTEPWFAGSRALISKQGSKLVRWAAIEATQEAPCCAWLKEDLRRIAERRNCRPLAREAVARKALTLVFYGLRDDEIRCLTTDADVVEQ